MKKFWRITDTATGSTDDWEMPQGMLSPTTLREAAEQIQMLVSDEDPSIYNPSDVPSPTSWGPVWDIWGFEPRGYNPDKRVLVARPFPNACWMQEHVLTATLIEEVCP